MDCRLASQKRHRNSPRFCGVLQAVRISFSRGDVPLCRKRSVSTSWVVPKSFISKISPSASPVLVKFCSRWKQWALNRAESMYYHGFYSEKVNVPSGLGYEALGKVIAVGPEVDPILIGKRFGTIPGF